MQDFLFWMMLINGSILVWWFIAITLMGDFVYKIHNKLLPLSKDSFAKIHYIGMGLFKMLWLFCNVAPYLTLAIIR